MSIKKNTGKRDPRSAKNWLNMLVANELVKPAPGGFNIERLMSTESIAAATSAPKTGALSVAAYDEPAPGQSATVLDATTDASNTTPIDGILKLEYERHDETAATNYDEIFKLSQDGKSYRQIATMLGVSKSKVERVLKKAPSTPAPGYTASCYPRTDLRFYGGNDTVDTKNCLVLRQWPVRGHATSICELARAQLKRNGS